LRALRDRLIEKFGLGKSLISWYYRVGPRGASWLNQHAAWKPVIRAGLIIPVSISKLLFVSKLHHKLAALLLLTACFAFAIGAGKHEEWSRKKTVYVGAGLAFFAVIVYGVLMTPKVVRADRSETELTAGKAYFLYEDHIGRPVLMSERVDDGDGSYFTENASGYPFWQAAYTPFGQVFDDFDSAGITIGNIETTGIVWSVPFRFPGQYQDDTAGLRNQLYYNWNRWYMPGMGRYTQADPIVIGSAASSYLYSKNNPTFYSDYNGLYSWVVSPLWGKFEGVSLGLGRK